MFLIVGFFYAYKNGPNCKAQVPCAYVSGQNYQSWRLDVVLHLQGEGLANTLVEDGKATAKDKANALIFMRRHLHDNLKV